MCLQCVGFHVFLWLQQSVSLIQPDDFADYAEVSESDSQSLARGLGLDLSSPLTVGCHQHIQQQQPLIVGGHSSNSHMSNSSLRLVLVDTDSQVSFQHLFPFLLHILRFLLVIALNTYLSSRFPNCSIFGLLLPLSLIHYLFFHFGMYSLNVLSFFNSFFFSTVSEQLSSMQAAEQQQQQHIYPVRKFITIQLRNTTKIKVNSL